MKILKVKIKREPNPQGGTHYVYPPEYDYKKIKVLCYEHVGDEATILKRGKYTYEYCIGVVEDKDAEQFLKSRDIVELTKEKALSLGRKWRPQIEKVTDENRVICILAKKARGESLSQKELNALDPEKEERGISKSRSFDDMLVEYV